MTDPTIALAFYLTFIEPDQYNSADALEHQTVSLYAAHLEESRYQPLFGYQGDDTSCGVIEYVNWFSDNEQADYESN